MQVNRRTLTVKKGLYHGLKKYSQEQTRTFFLKEIPFKNLVITSLVINLATLAFVVIVKNQLPPQIPLYYGLPKTEEQVANSTSLIIPGILATSIMVINILIAQVANDDYLRKILILTGVVGAFLSTITTLKIIFLVGGF